MFAGFKAENQNSFIRNQIQYYTMVRLSFIVGIGCCSSGCCMAVLLKNLCFAIAQKVNLALLLDISRVTIDPE